MSNKRTNNVQDLQYFGEYGGVNPSISDSSTYTFLSAKTMFDTFEGNTEGCYLYSRHSSPSNLYLGEALAALEGTETANVYASGMGAITAVIFVNRLVIPYLKLLTLLVFLILLKKIACR